MNDIKFHSLFLPPIAPTTNYSCPVPSPPHKVLNDFHLRGTALGGWMVLEPWITPSLFYQFLGATEKWGAEAQHHVAIDSYTFCTALGDEEANRQLRNHWETWVTEEQISNLHQMGVKHLRLPVGDWMYLPYEPFIGCWDGALEEVDRVLALCGKYDIQVFIDLHALRGSQNGLDNSGNTQHYTWFTTDATDSTPAVLTYEHWNIRGGDWVGLYNTTTRSYHNINSTNIIDSLRVINVIVDMYKDNPVVIGIEPVNEPWEYIPMPILKEFYWRAYLIVQHKVPHWITLLHDSFRLNNATWGGDYFKNCDNYAVDTHIYQAWAWSNPVQWFQLHACEDGANLRFMESIGVPIIVGEWSLATDNCAMWLNGLNDNVPGYPQVKCERIQCPQPYTNVNGYLQPNAPPNASLPAQDPFGLGGESYVIYGTCPRDKPFPNDLNVMHTLSYAKLHAFDLHTHGQFFWNFRTEFEPRWDFQQSVTNGWIPTDWDLHATQSEITNTCDIIMHKANITVVASIATNPPSNDRIASLKSMSRSFVAISIALCLVIGMYWLLRYLIRRYPLWSRRYVYQTIDDADFVDVMLKSSSTNNNSISENNNNNSGGDSSKSMSTKSNFSFKFPVSTKMFSQKINNNNSSNGSSTAQLLNNDSNRHHYVNIDGNDIEMCEKVTVGVMGTTTSNKHTNTSSNSNNNKHTASTGSRKQQSQQLQQSDSQKSSKLSSLPSSEVVVSPYQDAVLIHRC